MQSPALTLALICAPRSQCPRTLLHCLLWFLQLYPHSQSRLGQGHHSRASTPVEATAVQAPPPPESCARRSCSHRRSHSHRWSHSHRQSPSSNSSQGSSRRHRRRSAKCYRSWSRRHSRASRRLSYGLGLPAWCPRFPRSHPWSLFILQDLVSLLTRKPWGAGGGGAELVLALKLLVDGFSVTPPLSTVFPPPSSPIIN